jgi:hypothetical protein
MPPSQFKASVDTLVTNLLKSRLDTIRSQFQSAMGKPASFTMLTPHSREVLKQLNIDPTSIDSATDAAGAPIAAPVAGSVSADPLGEARAAIAAGAPRDAVIKRLQDNGIDASGL